MVSPLFQVTSMERLLSTPFSLAHTLAAERAVLFSPNSIILYRLFSSFMINPRLISEVLAIMYCSNFRITIFESAKLNEIGHSTKTPWICGIVALKYAWGFENVLIQCARDSNFFKT